MSQRITGSSGSVWGLAGAHEEQVILVTKDLLLRIKAQILGICAEDFTTDQVLDHEKQYSGRCELYVPEELFKDFKKKGVPADRAYVTDAKGKAMRRSWRRTSL